MPTTLTAEELAAVITTCAGVPVTAGQITAVPAAAFEELGIDSLGVLGIVTELENRFGIQLGDDPDARSPQDLLERITTRLKETV
ncbi:acyl carrier protein [Streptomyces eurythermus]|uniref:acyl carrier protein n=1 Tax=Streptomyces eurythermus TaxID=42237 RepID=UPI0036A7AC55